jgi:hypothetical protein
MSSQSFERPSSYNIVICAFDWSFTKVHDQNFTIRLAIRRKLCTSMSEASYRTSTERDLVYSCTIHRSLVTWLLQKRVVAAYCIGNLTTQKNSRTLQCRVNCLHSLPPNVSVQTESWSHYVLRNFLFDNLNALNTDCGRLLILLYYLLCLIINLKVGQDTSIHSELMTLMSHIWRRQLALSKNFVNFIHILTHWLHEKMKAWTLNI